MDISTDGVGEEDIAQPILEGVWSCVEVEGGGEVCEVKSTHMDSQQRWVVMPKRKPTEKYYVWLIIVISTPAATVLGL